MSLIWFSFLALFFLGVSAFFSGSETGFMSCSYLKVTSKAKEDDSLSKILLHLLHRKHQMILICLIGVNMSNTIYSLAFDLLFQKSYFLNSLPKVWFRLIQISLITLVLVVFSEIFPKILFYEYSFRLTRKSSRVLIFFKKLMQPLIHLFFKKEKLRQAQKPNLKLDTIRMMSHSQSKGSNLLMNHQQNMIQHVSSLREKHIKSFMFPMHILPHITEDDMIQEAWNKIINDDTPFFVWNKNRVKGVLNIQDLYKVSPQNRIKDLPYEPLVSFQSTTKALFLLKIFLKKKFKNEIERDEIFLIEEQGKTIGYISLQRLLNPIFSFVKS